MAMLKFRRGLYSQITNMETNPLANGTIYIATDEKAMYVDTATDRIRIGDFIRVNTVKDITPPYSESALYYVEADNALLKYTGAEGGWKQINGTDDIRTELAAVKGDVATLKSTVGSATSGLVKAVADNTTAIGNINTEIGVTPSEGVEGSGLKKAIADNAADIVNLKAAIGMGEDGKVEGLDGRVTQAEKDIDTLESAVQGHTNSISTLNGQVATKAEKSYVDETFVTKTNASATYATKTELNDAKTAISSEIDADVKEEADRAIAAEGALRGRITTLENAGYQNASQVGTAIDNKITAARVEISKEIDDDVAALKSEVARDYALKTELSAVDSVVKGHTQDISDINDALNTHKTEAEQTYAKKTDVYTKTEVYTKAEVNSAIDADVLVETNRAKGEEARIEDLVSTAQAKAESAYELAEGKTTAAEVKDQIEEYGYATTGYVDQAEADAVAKAKEDGDKAYAAKSIEQTVSSHENYITNTLKGAATVVGSVAEAKKAGDDALALIGDANSGLTQTVNAHTTSLATLTGADSVNGSVANAKKAGTDAAKQAETNRQNIASLTATVDKLDGTVETEGSVKKQIKDAVDAAKTALSAEIDADIRAANAMEYAGTIESASAIPTSGVKNGATYVIGTSFDSYAAGDMLIAQGTENPDTGLITNPTWAHVKSGYDATLDQQLTGANNKIMLSNGVRNDEDAAGTITFKATGSASVSVADNTVTIGMVWEDF